ncbi:MAG: hypothetical protein BWY70_01734 [Bacteroidetes bacterium ADurb.Bin408]|nr:MAG: hypothetical protein BWY70_01734 [Bacteroidetes bacterium ADurb.Bin408]
MKNRYVEFGAQLALDDETFGRLDVFEVDAPKRRFKRFYYLYKFFRVFFIDLDVKHINICKDFE